MFAIDLRSTIRFPCACGTVPVRENTVRDLGFTVVVNNTDPLVHHILNALAPDTVSYKCDMCHLQSSDERLANKQSSVLTLPRFLRITITAPRTAAALPPDRHQYGPLREYESLDLS